jgi:hypothetical protein
MRMIDMPDGRRFVATQWHGAYTNTIPAHVDAVATCRACGIIRDVPSRLYRIHGNETMDIENLARRLRCSDCGARDADLFFGYFAGELPPL